MTAAFRFEPLTPERRADFHHLLGDKGAFGGCWCPVWAITCFYVHSRSRHQGLMIALIEAACAYARDQGAPAIEAFPVDPERLPAGPPAFSAFMGFRSAFDDAGFKEVARRNQRQPVMRRQLS